MKKNLFIVFLLLNSIFLFSQNAQYVINGSAYTVFNGGTAATPVYLVVDNPNITAITQPLNVPFTNVSPCVTPCGGSGGFVSESEYNMVKWNIGANIGIYTVPFYYFAGSQYIPLTTTITSAGSAGGNIKFSTYHGPTYDNATYMPTGVTNMGNVTIPVANNSAKVTDRFWILDATSYASKPNVTLSFTYVDAENTAASSTITEANLGAQRWNQSAYAGAGDWDGFLYPPAGTIVTATNIVSLVNAPAADFYRSWTLVDNTTPLPIELLDEEAACSDKNVVIKWTTATEKNNDFFTIERSIDGINFTDIGTVPGAGNSTSILNYSYTDYNSFNGISYYRLKQTDYNGANKTFNMITAQNCNSSSTDVNAYNNQNGNIAIIINSESGSTYTASLYDALGKKISS
ncbi:MAG: hypothetical protein ACXVPM_08805, partial [Bacteroidia bacterium]